MITIDDFLRFSAGTLESFRITLERLDESTINSLPPLPEPNSPYQLAIHTVSAVDWWTSHVILGNPTDRDRPKEFTATGSLVDAIERIDACENKLGELAPLLATATDIAPGPRAEQELGPEWTVGACLIHAYEEMAQHLGHLEITVDLLTT